MKPNHPLKKYVQAAIVEVYAGLPAVFYAWSLFRKVQHIIVNEQGRYIYADTVMRYFREMCRRGVIRCQCVNRQRSLYIKNDKP
jgi:hypothetical protein